jgi:dCTP deaminase
LGASAFCARLDEETPIDLSQGSTNKPCKYWKILQSEDGRLQIQKNDFYILRSKQRIKTPKGIAVYCKAIDETIGEMRIHYAGFVHPGFGIGREDEQPGTPLIFEVRGHDVNVCLQDDEKLAKLIFYRMSEENDCQNPEHDYNNQELKLSKFFAPWGAKLRMDEDGIVSEE